MTLRTKIEIAAAAALLIYGMVELRAWHNADKAQAVAMAQQHDNDAQQKLIDSAIEARAKQWAEERAELVAKQQSDMKSVGAMVASLNQALAAAGKPPIVVMPAAPEKSQAGENRAVPENPQAGSIAILPIESVQPLFKASTDLPICRGDLTKCQADAAAWKDKFDKEQQQNANLQSALKGGTWRLRARKALKCAGLAAGLAGIGAVIDRQSPGRGAAIGSGSGSLGCAIAF